MFCVLYAFNEVVQHFTPQTFKMRRIVWREINTNLELLSKIHAFQRNVLRLWLTDNLMDWTNQRIPFSSIYSKNRVELFYCFALKIKLRHLSHFYTFSQIIHIASSLLFFWHVTFTCARYTNPALLALLIPLSHLKFCPQPFYRLRPNTHSFSRTYRSHKLHSFTLHKFK